MTSKSNFEMIMQAYEQAHALKKVQEHLNSIKLDVERRGAWTKRIEELSDTKPPTYTICVIGGTGTGKSTLLCALLDKRVIPMSGSRASTAAIIKMVYNPQENFIAKITFFKKSWWLKEIKFVQTEIAEAQVSSSAFLCPEILSPEAKVSWDRVHEVYPKLDMNQLMHSNPEGLFSEVKQLLETTKTLCFGNVHDFLEELGPFVSTVTSDEDDPQGTDKPQIWPLVSMVEIHIHAEVLAHGLCLVDLPGIGDTNAARNNLARKFIENADEVWIVSEIQRIISKSIIEKCFKMISGILYADGRIELNRVALIATHVEVDSSKAEHLNAVQKRQFAQLNQDMESCKKQLHTLQKKKESTSDTMTVLPVIPMKRKASDPILQAKLGGPSNLAAAHSSPESSEQTSYLQELKTEKIKLEHHMNRIQRERNLIVISARNTFISNHLRRTFAMKMASKGIKLSNGANIAVFCVGSKDHLAIESMTDLPEVFETREETGILAIQNHAEKQLLAFQTPAAALLLIKSKSLLTEVSVYLRKWQEVDRGRINLGFRTCKNDELANLKTKLDDVTNKCEKEFALQTKHFQEQLRDILNEVRSTAETPWKDLAESITHHGTYRRIMLRNGELGEWNFNEALVDRVVQSGDIYQSFFVEKLPPIISALHLSIEKAVTTSVEAIILASGPELSNDIKNASEGITIRTLSEDVESNSIRAINNSRRKLIHAFSTTMKRRLKKHYQEVSLETGPGMLARMKEANLAYISKNKGELFDGIAKTSEKQTGDLVNMVFKKIQKNGNADIISHVKRVLSVSYEDVTNYSPIELQRRDSVKILVMENMASIDRLTALLEEEKLHATVV